MYGINVSRSLISEIKYYNPVSLGSSYTHVTTLKDVIGPDTKKIVMYHGLLENLDGFEKANKIEIAYIGFNRITKFQPLGIKNIGVLDLVGNPIESLEHCPPCTELIVSACRFKDLKGCPEGINKIRCGHSLTLESLEGCPQSVELIECSCAPNLVIKNEHLPKGLKELITSK